MSEIAEIIGGLIESAACTSSFDSSTKTKTKTQKGFSMLKAFNAFQIVAAFVAWPFLIMWLASAQFTGHTAAFYASCALYVVAFFGMVYSVYCNIANET